MSKSIAIIGAGPAGCALACMLRERGLECIIFDDDKTPSMLVGESLVPAAMPIIRRLGIEQEIAKFSQVKKGAALRHAQQPQRVDFAFRKLANNVPDYAYNIPRPKFDDVLRQRAKELGVKFVMQAAKVEVADRDASRDLQLTDQSLAAASISREAQPQLLIDATGRSRLFSRLLKLPARRGPRNDIAHFAHFNHCPSDSALPGQIVISVLECGWSWQIPLLDTTSVGVVMNAKAASHYGSNASERLTNVMQANSVLNKPQRQLASDVNTYANYQLISQQGHGNGWALLGDAHGFVDPMLSPGVFMALESANLMDKLVFSNGLQLNKKSFDQYYRELQQWHDAWSQLIEYFYDGRLLALSSKRPEMPAQQGRFSFSKVPDLIISGVLSRLVSGAGTRSKLHRSALYRICQLACRDQALVADFAIKDFP